jgi:hypothetical protein
MRTDGPNGRVVEVYPFAKFGVEEECAVMFAIVCDQSYQLQDCADCRSTLTNGVENLLSEDNYGVSNRWNRLPFGQKYGILCIHRAVLMSFRLHETHR